MDLDESIFSEDGDEVTLQQVFEELNTVEKHQKNSLFPLQR